MLIIKNESLLTENLISNKSEKIYCLPWTLLFRYEYRWADGVDYKKPTPLPAPKYVSLLMDWIESQINNEEIFPVKMGNVFTQLCNLHLLMFHRNTFKYAKYFLFKIINQIHSFIRFTFFYFKTCIICNILDFLLLLWKFICYAF